MWTNRRLPRLLEFAQVAVEELWSRYRRDHKNDVEREPQNCPRISHEANRDGFSSPLSDEQRAMYVDQQVDATQDDSEANKRSLLMALKSPWFLYPTANTQSSKSQRTANRLALILFDSLPAEDRLVKAAREGRWRRRSKCEPTRASNEGLSTASQDA